MQCKYTQKPGGLEEKYFPSGPLQFRVLCSTKVYTFFLGRMFKRMVKPNQSRIYRTMIKLYKGTGNIS